MLTAIELIDWATQTTNPLIVEIRRQPVILIPIDEAPKREIGFQVMKNCAETLEQI